MLDDQIVLFPMLPTQNVTNSSIFPHMPGKSRKFNIPHFLILQIWQKKTGKYLHLNLRSIFKSTPWLKRVHHVGNPSVVFIFHLSKSVGPSWSTGARLCRSTRAVSGAQVEHDLYQRNVFPFKKWILESRRPRTACPLGARCASCYRCSSKRTYMNPLTLISNKLHWKLCNLHGKQFWYEHDNRIDRGRKFWQCAAGSKKHFSPKVQGIKLLCVSEAFRIYNIQYVSCIYYNIILLLLSYSTCSLNAVILIFN